MFKKHYMDNLNYLNYNLLVCQVIKILRILETLLVTCLWFDCIFFLFKYLMVIIFK